jgi:LPXTG-site transpeptidase (sortase) family protein
MASDDTLNIGSIRLKKEYPMTNTQPREAVDPVLHPQAAAIARERIANLPDAGELLREGKVPSAPTSELITDKAALAAQHTQTKSKSTGSTSSRKLPSAVKPMLTAVGIFAIVLMLFKAPIIISQIGYSFNDQKQSDTTTAPAVTETVPAENTISIPKINVKAPVNYEPSIQEAAIQKSLETGVVHYGNTQKPGENGNVAIFGHSSNDWWEPGNYKFVFVLLDKLAPGDKVTVDYQSKRYVYEVTGSRVVEPTEVSVLNRTPTPTLTLITCSPPGTSLKRLVVTAKQISPDPSQATSVAVDNSTGGTTQSTINGSESGFFDQVSQAWDGVVSSFKSLFGGDSAPNTDPNSAESSPNQIPAIK